MNRKSPRLRFTDHIPVGITYLQLSTLSHSDLLFCQISTTDFTPSSLSPSVKRGTSSSCDIGQITIVTIYALQMAVTCTHQTTANVHQVFLRVCVWTTAFKRNDLDTDIWHDGSP